MGRKTAQALILALQTIQAEYQSSLHFCYWNKSVASSIENCKNQNVCNL